MGDFNARAPILTGDTRNNGNTKSLLDFINKHSLYIANSTFTYGIPTLKNNGSGIIDFVINDNPGANINLHT